MAEISAGDDLAALLQDALKVAGLWPLLDGDVLVITQKILSKAEGRMVDLAQVEPTPEALELATITKKDPRLVELVLRESVAVVRAVPHILITRHRLGHVMANSGIDRQISARAARNGRCCCPSILIAQLPRSAMPLPTAGSRLRW